MFKLVWDLKAYISGIACMHMFHHHSTVTSEMLLECHIILGVSHSYSRPKGWGFLGFISPRAPHSFLSGFIVIAQLPPLTSMLPHPFDCHHAARLPNGTDERERQRGLGSTGCHAYCSSPALEVLSCSEEASTTYGSGGKSIAFLCTLCIFKIT